MPGLTIRQIMDTEPPQIEAGSSMQRAAAVLSASRCSDLAVVGDRGTFVGTLSEGDLIRAALPTYDDAAGAGGSIEAAFDAFVSNGRALADQSIDRIVIGAPIVADPDDDVLSIAVAMVSKQIRRLPVVEDGALVGTVSRADICRAVVVAPGATD